MTARIDEVLQAAVDAGAVPGVVAMAAGPDGVLYEGAAGKRSAAADDPITPDTMMRIASMTKMVTITAALQLVERGRLDLDAPVREYRPEFGDLPVLTGFDGDTPAAPPGQRAGHGAAARHAHGGVRLLDLGPGDRPLRAGHGHAQRDARHDRRVQGPDAVRPGHPVRVRDQRGLAGPGDRGGDRADAGRLFPGEHHRAARHGEHHGADDAGAAGQLHADSRPRRGRRLDRHRPGLGAAAGLLGRRPLPLQHAPRLPEAPADAARRRDARRTSRSWTGPRSPPRSRTRSARSTSRPP